MIAPESETGTYGWRERHVGRLLLELLRDFQFRSIEQLRVEGYADITLAYVNFIASVQVSGTRLTDIAQTLDVSKQAAGQMAKELVNKGYLSRQPDPEDGRATLLTFTANGERLLSDAKKGVEDVEMLYERLVGEESFESLKGLLLELLTKTRSA